jgi:hypothetical protein
MWIALLIVGYKCAYVNSCVGLYLSVCSYLYSSNSKLEFLRVIQLVAIKDIIKVIEIWILDFLLFSPEILFIFLVIEFVTHLGHTKLDGLVYEVARGGYLINGKKSVRLSSHNNVIYCFLIQFRIFGEG